VHLVTAPGGDPWKRTNPTGGDPRKYVTIAGLVRGQIAAGKLAPGELVVAYMLAAQCDVALGTVTRALRMLVDEGLLSAPVRGFGYRVKSQERG
jgi:DNA-binding GntR family transcriptional regulator